MTSLGQVVFAVENYRRFIFEQVLKARTDSEFGEQVLKKWREAKAKIGVGITPTGLQLPRLALPDLDEAGEIVRFICAEGLPGEFTMIALVRGVIARSTSAVEKVQSGTRIFTITGTASTASSALM